MQWDAVLFDCDGVLVDSEPITNTVLRVMLAEAGWVLTPLECMQIFIGKTVRSEALRIEQYTGTPLTDAWMQSFYERRDAALRRDLQPMPGAVGAVQAIHHAFHGKVACASGADRSKVEMQLTQVGLMPYFEGRIFSGHEMSRTKPAPDVYLAAARALQVLPERCCVVEDTPVGVMAGVAAGADVLGLRPPGDAGLPHIREDDLRDAGACAVLTSMAVLPQFLMGDEDARKAALRSPAPVSC